MATITRTERRKRGPVGWIFLVLFWGFNGLMVLSLFAGLSDTAAQMETLTSEAQRAGHAAGTAIGVGLILMFWAAGAIILGLFVWLTAGKKVIVETTEN